jgi:galactitol-specific phosphotransferase system IIC component
MLRRRSSFLIALAIGLVVGISYPIVDLGLACRAPSSEACVWGKAYLPLTLAVSVVLLGGVVTALVYAALMWRRCPSNDDAA